MKIILQISGRDITFSEYELTTILEKYFTNQATEQVLKTKKVIETPTEGKWFEINPLDIDQELFQEKRFDLSQEQTRQLILEAFDEVKNKPEKYGRKFETMMPKGTGGYKTIEELKKLAENFGDRLANRVEQALEWAQRIANGESWKTVCNDADTANWYRLIAWNRKSVRKVGGSKVYNTEFPATYVREFYYSYEDKEKFRDMIPLVVRYKK